MEKKIKGLKGISNCIRFYSLIYGIILLIFSIIWIFGTIFMITTVSFYPANLIVGPSLLAISCIITGSLLVITYYGLTHSKDYAKLTGILGCCIILMGLIITLLFTMDSFTLGTVWPAIVIVVIPSSILIILIAMFWNHLSLEEKSK